MDVDNVKKQTEALKERTNKNPGTLFVDKDVTVEKMLAADAAGKKLIFDHVDFPEFKPEDLAKLSKRGRQAYSMDSRVAGRGKERIEEGKSPYTSLKKDLEFTDPLAAAHSTHKFTVTNEQPGYKYIFPSPEQIHSLIGAGYEYVTKNDPEHVVGGRPDEHGNIVIMNGKGKVDNYVVKVNAEAYKKHIEYYGRLSKKRIGRSSAEVTNKLKRFESRIKTFDDSELVEK